MRGSLHIQLSHRQRRMRFRSELREYSSFQLDLSLNLNLYLGVS